MEKVSLLMKDSSEGDSQKRNHDRLYSFMDIT